MPLLRRISNLGTDLRIYQRFNIEFINTSLAHTDMSAMKVDVDPLATTSAYRNKQQIKEHELNQTIRTLIVPTIDEDVRKALRKLGEPVTYFGEDKADRRSRLARLMAELRNNGREGLLESIQDTVMEQALRDEEDEDEEFYTPGGPELLAGRRKIAKYSLQRARIRLDRQRTLSSLTTIKLVKFRRSINEQLKAFTQLGTQSGFLRPVSATRFSPNSQYLATGDWSGTVRLFSVPRLNQISQLAGHSGKTVGVEWHPRATINQSETSLNLASGGVEGNIQLWNLQETKPLATLKGHEAAVSGIDFHPSGQYLASASDDYTWRLWDLEAQKELLAQEGHSKEILTVRIQCDGALLGSAGKDAIARIWDLRLGTVAMILDGHIREIYSLDFAPNGYEVATASGDNSVMIWDLRQTKSTFTIPAHTKLVSGARFFRGQPEGLQTASSYEIPTAGTFLVTSSYDRLIKIWSADNWTLQKTLEDSERALCVDISNDQRFIASGRYDRYVSLWAPGNIEL